MEARNNMAFLQKRQEKIDSDLKVPAFEMGAEKKRADERSKLTVLYSMSRGIITPPPIWCLIQCIILHCFLVRNLEAAYRS